MNQTLQNFDYPHTLIKEYKHWVVLLRPRQVTLGSLVLAEKSEATSVADISEEAFAELKVVTTDIETALKDLFGAEKFNYLMLMMVDPNVHYHVIPRYSAEKIFEYTLFKDTGWPKLPEMAFAHDISVDVKDKLLAQLKEKMKS